MYSLIFHSHQPKYTILYNKHGGENFIGNSEKKSKKNSNPTQQISTTIERMVGSLLKRNSPEEWQDTIITPDSHQESNNVIRKHTVVSIGDLNGNYGAFLGNLTSVGLIDKDNHWIGGDTRVVVHGDI